MAAMAMSPPAFLRRQADDDQPSRRVSVAERLKSLFSRPEAVEESPSAVSTATSFVRWLEANAARLADQKQPFPTLDELANAGLSDDLLTQLRKLVAQGETEEAVVTALLHAFLRHGPKCQLPRNASRNVRAHFQRQVSATLAATVEALVKTWCATG